MNSDENIILQISGPIYSGFQYKIPKSYIMYMTSDEIIKEIKIYMKNFFKSYNLYILEEGIDKLNLHIHEDISIDKDIIYICVHCNNKN
jgi:hypothetical protein